MWTAVTVLWTAVWLATDPVYNILGKRGLTELWGLRVETVLALAALSFYQFVFSAMLAGGVALWRGEKLQWLPRSTFEVGCCC